MEGFDRDVIHHECADSCPRAIDYDKVFDIYTLGPASLILIIPLLGVIL